jgi:hypothetical protein
MDIKTELLVRIVLAIVLVFFFSKIVGNILLHYFDVLFNKKKTKDIHIDDLVNHQTALLRGKSNSSEPIDNNSKTGTSIDAISAYKHELADASRAGDKQKRNDIQKVIDLHDCIQWGDGEAVKTLMTHYSKKYSVSFELTNVMKQLKQTISGQSLLSLYSSLPTYDELTKILGDKIYAEVVYDSAIDINSKLVQTHARRYKVRDQAIINALQFILLSFVKNDQNKLFNEIITTKSSILKNLKQHERRKVVASVSTNISEILSTIKQQAQLFDSLLPLPDLKNKKDLDGAFLIFNLPKSVNFNEVKDRYKELSKLMHPDTFAGHKLPKSAERLSHDNFVKIQSAYDLLKTNFK